MLTSESRKPRAFNPLAALAADANINPAFRSALRVQLDSADSEPMALDTGAAQRVYRERVLGEPCHDCVTRARCAVDGCGGDRRGVRA